MSIMKRLLTTAALLLTVVMGRTQTADEIINKWVQAMGGDEKLGSIKTAIYEGSVDMRGNAAPIVITRVQNKLTRTDAQIMGSGMYRIVTDAAGWSYFPMRMTAAEPLTPEAVKAQQIELDIQGPMYQYAAKGHKVELLGKQDVDGTEAWAIKVTLKSGDDVTYFIDPTSYLIIRRQMKAPPGGGMGGGGGRGPNGGGGAGGDMIIDYSDYKKTDDGYMFPFAQTGRGMMGTVKFTKIEVNKEVDASLYKPD